MQYSNDQVSDYRQKLQDLPGRGCARGRAARGRGASERDGEPAVQHNEGTAQSVPLNTHGGAAPCAADCLEP